MMRISYPKTWFGLSLLVLVVLAGTGCSHNSNAPAPPTTSLSKQQIMDARIKDVQNNPNIPQEDKARTIAGMQAQTAGPGTQNGH
jgi:hypothetical protein